MSNVSNATTPTNTPAPAQSEAEVAAQSGGEIQQAVKDKNSKTESPARAKELSESAAEFESLLDQPQVTKKQQRQSQHLGRSFQGEGGEADAEGGDAQQFAAALGDQGEAVVETGTGIEASVEHYQPLQTQRPNVLASAAQSSNAVEAVQPTVTEAAKPTRSSANQTIDSLANQVANRILVSESRGQTTEVQIQVRESILPDTNIRIVQDQGALRVSIATSQNESFQLLSNQQSNLILALEQRVQREVSVNVELNDSGQPSDQSNAGQGDQGRDDQRQQSEDEQA